VKMSRTVWQGGDEKGLGFQHLVSALLHSARGDWNRAIVGWYLASRLLNLGYPFQYMCADDELHPSLFHIALYLLILERISQVARTADTNISGAIQVFFMP
jgi:hypothetical protein